MRLFIERWRRIGTRLYLALFFAVVLTLISGAVGVFYFEQSGDLNYRLQSESVPALEASWTVARETERLRNIGLSLVAEPELGFQGLGGGYRKRLRCNGWLLPWTTSTAFPNCRQMPRPSAQRPMIWPTSSTSLTATMRGC